NLGTIGVPVVLTNLGFLYITRGEPNIYTLSLHDALPIHGNSYLDFDDPAGKLRVLAGGVYNTINTSGDFGFRQFSGGQGVAAESGGLLPHYSPVGLRLLTKTGNAPAFELTDGLHKVVTG